MSYLAAQILVEASKNIITKSDNSERASHGLGLNGHGC